MTAETVTLDEYRDFIQQHYQRRHSDLYSLSTNMFVPSFREALRQGTRKSLLEILKQVHPEVFAFDMFDRDFCRRLIEEMDSFEAWCSQNDLHKNVPNTMNHYGAVLDDFGFWPFLHQLMDDAVTPVARLLYADAGGGSLDDHHGFVVEYAPGKDTSLDFHVDASDVTLNVCLGDEFTGGELYFGGIRCAAHQTTQPRPEEEFEIVHRPGQALLHRGKHRHAAETITSGRRMNLILWCMSTSYQQSHDPQQCQPWCLWQEVTAE